MKLNGHVGNRIPTYLYFEHQTQTQYQADHIAKSTINRKSEAGVFNRYSIGRLRHHEPSSLWLSLQCPHEVFYTEWNGLKTCTYANKIKLWDTLVAGVPAPSPDVRTSNTNLIYPRNEGTYNTCSVHMCSGKGERTAVSTRVTLDHACLTSP